ncbi:MAG: hypothetical protein JW716_04165 [Candidatus Aenigmarchaeota archaeon]|nr:hypothetical protein [Candidatus Aenigmarchaeota archaeon]
MKLRKMPTLREKKRYLKFRLETDAKEIPYFELKDVIWNAVMRWIGEKGAGQSNFKIIKNLWVPDRKEGVVSCSPKFVDDIKVALATIQYIGDAKTIFTVTKVSGTIKSFSDEKTKNNDG